MPAAQAEPISDRAVTAARSGTSSHVPPTALIPAGAVTGPAHHACGPVTTVDRCANQGDAQVHNRGCASPAAPRPLHVCSRCGTLAPAHTNGQDQGPVCRECYTSPPRTCGTCGLDRPIAKQAVDGQPDVCVHCYRGRRDGCSICSRTLDGVTRFHGGALICTNCRPRTPKTCSLCRRRRHVQANWPLGSIYSSCYSSATRHPTPCTRCATTRVLVGHTDDGERICGPCTGVDINFTCLTCSHPGDIYADGRCARCVVSDRATDLLRHDNRPVTAQLLPLQEALIRATNPRSVIAWLRSSPVVRLIADLVEKHATISHDHLDSLPPTRTSTICAPLSSRSTSCRPVRNSWPGLAPGSTPP